MEGTDPDPELSFGMENRWQSRRDLWWKKVGCSIISLAGRMQSKDQLGSACGYVAPGR